MRTSAGLLMQRMEADPGPPDPNAIPVLGVFTLPPSVAIEGATVQFEVRRLGGDITKPVLVNFAWNSAAGAGDFANAITGTVALSAGQTSKPLSMGTINRAGTQGDREVRVTLSDPVDALVRDDVKTAVMTLRDYVAALPVFGVYPVNPTAVEGGTIQMEVRRLSGTNEASIVPYAWESDGGSSDLVGGLTGNATFGVGVNAVRISRVTANRAGLQGNRDVRMRLNTPTVGTVQPGNDVATTQLQDFVAAPVTPEIGVFAVTTLAEEGDTVQFEVRRLAGDTTACSATFTWTSTGGNADFTGTVHTGTVSLGSGVNEVTLSKVTAVRSGDQGERTVTLTLTAPVGCTIRSGDASDTVVVDDPSSVPAGLPKYHPTVPVSRWHCVGFVRTGAKATYEAGRTGLLAALAAANLIGGDQIVLANGTYSGALVTVENTSGTTYRADGTGHIVIRSLNHLGATLNLPLRIDDPNIWITGVRSPYSQFTTGVSVASLELRRAPGFWYTNNECTSGGLIRCDFNAVAGVNVDNMKICFNDLLFNVAAARTFVTLLSFFDMPESARAPNDVDIAYNIIRQNTLPSGTGDAAQRAFLQLQNSKPANSTVAANRTFRIHHNHIIGYWRELFYTKRSIYIGFNYTEFSNGQPTQQYYTQRHGALSGNAFNTGGMIEGNRIRCWKRVSFEINGFGNTIQGNHCEGQDADSHVAIFLQGGSTFPPTGTDKTGLYDAASYCMMIENTGDFPSVLVGEFTQNNILDNSRGGFPTNVRVYRGDAGWNPAVTFGADANGARTPASSTQELTGYPAGYTKVIPITAAELLAVCGCDNAA